MSCQLQTFGRESVLMFSTDLGLSVCLLRTQYLRDCL
jgi:hypothetical protein